MGHACKTMIEGCLQSARACKPQIRASQQPESDGTARLPYCEFWAPNPSCVSPLLLLRRCVKTIPPEQVIDPGKTSRAKGKRRVRPARLEERTLNSFPRSKPVLYSPDSKLSRINPTPPKIMLWPRRQKKMSLQGL